MEDDSVVVGDDESKIVTEFLLNTCRLLRPSKHNVRAAAVCADLKTQHPPDDDEVVVIPLTTGSVAEFYIQPMLSCVGDEDIMYHHSDVLAIPHGYPPPSQLPAEFHSRVKVFEIIDSEYPGYVYLMLSYLLIENIDGDKYDAEQYNRCLYASSKRPPCAVYEIHGPARTFSDKQGNASIDGVHCIRCLSWPTQASDWTKRRRNYDWPDSATVDHVVSNGCDVVCVAHRLCRQDEWMNKRQFRLSFSRAEIVLINSWMPVQQIVYHLLRVFVKTERLTDITDSTGTKMFSNYHIKTLMLWACELKPRSWWTDDLNVVRICVALLHMLSNCMKHKDCRHYFVNNCNLFDNSLQLELIASHLVSVAESWLSTWFVNNYLRKCAQLCPGRVSRLFDDVSTSMKLQNAVSAVVAWRLSSTVLDSWHVCELATLYISGLLYFHSLTVASCDYWIGEWRKIDSSLCVFFTAVAFLHVVYKTTRNGLNDELIDVLATVLEQFVVRRRHSNQLSSVLSLSQAAKLMKVVVNNPRSTVQLIEIELSKAYLYRALRCKDSDSESVYCLANVYCRNGCYSS